MNDVEDGMNDFQESNVNVQIQQEMKWKTNETKFTWKKSLN